MNQKLIREIGRSQRLDIVLALKRRGGLTVKELATLSGMSYMGIKDHCLALEKEKYLDTWRRPKRVGRPEMLYRLTPRAQALFPKEDNLLTVGVLEAVQQSYGPAAPTKILFGIFHQKGEAYRAKVQADSLEERATLLTRLRDEEGYLSELSPESPPQETAPGSPPAVPASAPLPANPRPRISFGPPPGGVQATAGMRARDAFGWQITEYHSPIEDLLRKYPILARLEREMFERVLGCPVRREEQALPGLYRCVFHLGYSSFQNH